MKAHAGESCYTIQSDLLCPTKLEPIDHTFIRVLSLSVASSVKSELPRHGPLLRAATLSKKAVEMFKQSHRNLGANFISSGAYAQSGPPAANATDGAEQEIEVAAAIRTCAVVDKSKKKKLQEEVPPVYTEVDKSKKRKKKIDDKNLYDTLDEPKKVFILVFFIYFTAIYHLQI